MYTVYRNDTHTSECVCIHHNTFRGTDSGANQKDLNKLACMEQSFSNVECISMHISVMSSVH